MYPSLGEFGAILDRNIIEREYITPGITEINGVIGRAIAILGAAQHAVREKVNSLFPDAEIRKGLDSF